MERLRRENIKLGDLLQGNFSDTPNVYELLEGTVVSWTLIQGAIPQDPTYGRIPKGHFEFSTEHTETIDVLSGTLEIKVERPDNTTLETTLRKNQNIQAPPKSNLVLNARTTVYYFCRYA